MRVAFMPLGQPQGREAILIHRFPVILARPARKSLTAEAWTVSPYHCRIDLEDGVLVVRDLGSKYGTYVNESRVREACLWPGSKLTVGLNSFFVCYSLPERGALTAKEADQGKAAKGRSAQEESDSAKEFPSGPGIDIVGLPEV